MSAQSLPVTPHRIVVAPAVSDFLVVQWFLRELPAHRIGWFSGLPDAQQVEIARHFRDVSEGK